MKREPKNERGGRGGGGVEEGNGLKRQLYKACIDRSGLLRFHAVYAFQNTKQKYFDFTHASFKFISAPRKAKHFIGQL